jgi:hypothetical protein
MSSCLFGYWQEDSRAGFAVAALLLTLAIILKEIKRI